MNNRFRLLTIYAVTIMTAVGTSAMPPALRAVENHFGITTDVASGLMAVFTLPGIFLTALLGIMSDSVGRRRILVPSLAVFAIGGACAFYAETFGHLLVIRLIQGVGAASLGALNVTLIGDYFSGTERTKFMGYNNSVLSVGTAAFPIISGALAGISWKLPFALPLLAAFVMILVMMFIKDSDSPRRSTSFAQYMQVAFTALRIRSVVVLLIVSVVTFALLFGPFLTFVQSYMKTIIAPNDANILPKIGAITSAMSVSTAIAASFLGTLTQRFSHKRMLYVSCILYAISLSLFWIMPNFVLLFIPSIVFGAAQAFNQPNVQSLIAAYAPEQQRGVFMSLNRTVSLLGQTLGPVFFGSVVYLQLIGNTEVFRFAAVFLCGAMCALVLAFIVRSQKQLAE